MRHTRLRPAILAALACAVTGALAATPAEAASTARVSNTIAVHAGPGTEYRRVGTLHTGEYVALRYCEPRDFYSWCELETGGWVLGSYLVGAAAKLQATPFRSLSTIRPFPLKR